MRPGLVIGARHVVRYTVPAHQTVPDLLPTLAEFRRGQPVFATGFMVGLMEAPCMAAVYPHLEPGEVTVGTLITMTHLSASPPGTSLAAEARAVAVEGRSVRFAVVVADAAGEIAAAGEHGLRVVDAARFRDRLVAKKAQLSRPGPSPLPRGTNGPHHRPRTVLRRPDRSSAGHAPPGHPASGRQPIYS
jgi:fluoroacetyl-CoA thioesterase